MLTLIKFFSIVSVALYVGMLLFMLLHPAGLGSIVSRLQTEEYIRSSSENSINSVVQNKPGSISQQAEVNSTKKGSAVSQNVKFMHLKSENMSKHDAYSAMWWIPVSTFLDLDTTEISSLEDNSWDVMKIQSRV